MDTITASTSAPPQPTKKPGLLINRNFGLLISGQTISIIGDMLFTTTLTIWIATKLAFGQSWAPLAVSGVLLAGALPSLLIGPFAGVFVDRAGKRAIMLMTDALRAVIIALMILVSGDISLPFIQGGRPPVFWTLGVIFGAVFIVNAADQFFRPSMAALIQLIVPETQQPKAYGLSQVSFALAGILGPAIAAAVFVAYGAAWALLANALSFAVSYLSIRAIREPQAPVRHVEERQAGFLSEFWEGVRYYFSNRVLVTLLIAIVVGVSGASALNALDVFFTTQNLGASTIVYGFVGAVYGLGAIVGALVMSAVAQRIGLARVLWLSMFIMGLDVIILSRLTSIAPALSLMFVIGFMNASLNVAAGPLMMRATPHELMGRVNSIFQPAMNLAILGSTALIGYLASVTLRDFHAAWLGMRFGPIDTIWLAGGALVAASGIVIMVGLWGVDRRERATGSAPTTEESRPDQKASVPVA